MIPELLLLIHKQATKAYTVDSLITFESAFILIASNIIQFTGTKILNRQHFDD